MSKELNIEQLKQSMAGSKKIAIICHTNPDGDAVGSATGLGHYLRSKGHEVSVLAPNDFPNFLKWIPGADAMILFDRHNQQFKTALDEAEILFCLDFNTVSRVGDAESSISAFEGEIVMIDHHPQPDDLADHLLSDTLASSTCELVIRFIHLLGDKVPNLDCAESLYSGILTDSGGFRFPSTSATTHRYVAELMDLGLNPSKIYDKIFNQGNEGRLRLLGHCLNDGLTVHPEFHAGFITLSMAKKAEFNFQKGDTEGTVNYPLGINGIIFSAIFIEDTDKVKISFRSVGDFDVNQLARDHFHGGGHRNAAGGRSDLSLAETIKKFEALLPSYKDQLAKCAASNS